MPEEITSTETETTVDSQPEGGQTETGEGAAGPTLEEALAKIAELEGSVADWKKKSRHNERQAKKGTDAPTEEPEKKDTDSRNGGSDDLLRDRVEMRFEAEAEAAGLDPDEVLEYVNLDRFAVDGKVDKTAIKDYVGKLAPKKPSFKQGIGVGPQGGGKTQLTQADLKGMTDEQIVKAENEGRLNTLLGRK